MIHTVNKQDTEPHKPPGQVTVRHTGLGPGSGGGGSGEWPNYREVGEAPGVLAGIVGKPPS